MLAKLKAKELIFNERWLSELDRMGVQGCAVISGVQSCVCAGHVIPRAANLYFLFLVVLNWVPVVEAFQKEITMIPLVVVLTVIAFKDALEDYRRYRFDKKINNLVAKVYSV